MENENDNGRSGDFDAGTAAGSNSGPAGTAAGRRINPDAVARARANFHARGNQGSSAQHVQREPGGNAGGIESGGSSYKVIGNNGPGRGMPVQNGRQNRPINRASNDAGSPKSRIEFSEPGTNGPGKPRTIEWNDEAQNPDVAVKPATKTPVRRNSKKQDVDTDTAATLIQMFFMLAVLTLGPHWQQADEDIVAAAEPLARMLSKMDKSLTGKINDYVDPVMFIYMMGVMCAKSSKQSPKKEKHQNAVPNNSAQSSVSNNGAETRNGTGPTNFDPRIVGW